MWTADDDEPDEPEKDDLDSVGDFIMEDPREGEDSSDDDDN